MEMLYYFIPSDDEEGRKNLSKTIEERYYIKPLHNMLSANDKEIINILEQNTEDGLVHIWGTVPGDRNTSRWEKLKAGDKILAYSQDKFVFYGTVFAKTRNIDVANEIWGNNKEGKTWELIYFIKDLKPVNIDRKDFVDIFDYEPNFKPHGFGNINKDKLELVLNKFGDIDSLINHLNEK